MKYHLLAVICITLLATSCDSDEDGQPTLSIIPPNSAIIVNEGLFQNGTGTISLYDIEEDTIYYGLFERQNQGAFIGNVLQHVFYGKEKSWLVVNNANTLIEVNENFEETRRIETLDFPRYFLPFDVTTAFVTQWTTEPTGELLKIDLTDFTIADRLNTGAGPENMILHNGELYIANSGGYETDVDGDSTVTVVDPVDFSVVRTLTVGRNPNSFAVDKNGDLWVSCIGQDPFYNDTNPEFFGSLVRIMDGVVDTIINTGQIGQSSIVADQINNHLYFVQGGFVSGDVYRFDVDNLVISDEPIYDNLQNAYSLNIHPSTNELYISEAKDFSSTGEIIVIDTDGIELNRIAAGVIPNGVVFTD